MKKHFSTIALFAVFFIGLSLLLYPTFSDWWNSFHQSRAIVDYDAALAKLEPEDYSKVHEQAEEYNKKLADLQFPLVQYKELDGYEEILDVTGNGIMGYISIDKINVELPVYHGTSEGVLQIAVGHMEGSSLPVGGESTHTIFSAHRGLPSARLFTDLDKLVEDDYFTITVLGQVLTYEVDQILIVEPQETDALKIVEGEDYCTLVTCTPYGINTHRMLVRGHRIDTVENKKVFVSGDAYQIEPIMVAPVIAVPMLLLLLIVLLIPKKEKKTLEIHI